MDASDVSPVLPPPPDIMNDPEYDPANSDDKSPVEADTCRICRSEGSPTEPLFYPCKCSGSIKFVHQDCLMEWLSHSNKKHCELCKTPFRFTKLYDSHMPHTLPLAIFLKRALIHSLRHILTWTRALAVAIVWLVVLPWCIRWSWRCLFYVLDAGWAKDPWLAKLQDSPLQSHNSSSSSNTTAALDSPAVPFQPIALSLSRLLFGALFNPWRPLAQTVDFPWNNATHAIPTDSTLLSDVKAVNSLTTSVWTNRFILDVLEGQILTFLVVIAFILVFLIREWVVQQQPIINAAAHVRDAERQVDIAVRAAQRVRDIDHQAEPIDDEARARALELLADFDYASSESAVSDDGNKRFIGWHSLEKLMENAGAPHEFEGEDHEQYMQAVEETRNEVTEQLRLALDSDISPTEVAEKLFIALEKLEPTEKDLWWDILLRDYETKKMMLSHLSPENVALADLLPSEIEESSSATAAQNEEEEEGEGEEEEEKEEEEKKDEEGAAQSPLQRPVMPPREVSSHAQKVLRTLEERESDHPSHVDTGTSSRGSWQSVSDSTSGESTRSQTAGQGPPDVLSTDGKNVGADNLPLNNKQTEGVQSDTTHEEAGPAELSGNDVLAPETNEENGSISGQATTPQGEEVINQRPEENPLDQAPDDTSSKTYIGRLFDWFWADITLEPEAEPLPGVDDEQIVQNEAEEPPFVHIHADHPEPEPEAGAQDPEVLQAAAEAGLDAEAVEEAEDLEGILELIGMQGPLVGLLQTAMFCGVLITVTLCTAVGAPYLFGKIALILIGDPIMFMIMAPLRLISLTADAIVDSTIYVGGAATYFGTQAVSQLLSLLFRTLPVISGTSYFDFLAKRAHTAANAAAGRLSDSFSGEGPFETGFLIMSMHARYSLITMKAQVATILSFFARFVSGFFYHAQHSTVLEICQLFVDVARTGFESVVENFTCARTILQNGFESTVSNGSFTLTISRDMQTLDPTLASWNSSDRFLTIVAGYIFLATIGTVYLLRQESLFSSPSLQKFEKSFTDFLKQAGGVLKVILIISIEMLVFPLYCGLLLDCALLPLFENSSPATRFAFANRSPWLFAFLHWFLGTCYMFHFALFVSMCRRIMRNGVLYFIRDPDDPTFHPVRDVLERSVATQLRKIAFSALVYGGLVIVCLGGVIWSIARVFDGVFPVQWAKPEPVLEFPIDFLIYNLMAPVVARFLYPSKGMEKIFGHWLKFCARTLRLSEFLFGERRKVEEGRLANESWFSKINPWKDEVAITSSAAFVKDGRYVRAPASDQVRIPRGEGVFLQVTEDDERMDGNENTGIHARQTDKFTKVYVPPWFRSRITCFIACLWGFAISAGFGVTVVPMLFGRKILSLILPERFAPNDLYAFAVGLVVLGVTLQLLINGRSGCRKVINNATKQTCVTVGVGMKTQVARLSRNMYVYGFALVVVPTLFALVLQLYLILPLHTYMGSSEPAVDMTNTTTEWTSTPQMSLRNMTLAAAMDGQGTEPMVTSHKFHILQDWTLGFIYGRVVLRLLLLSRNSRPAAAFRMITRDGFTNPNARLATRAFVLPTLFLFTLSLLCPPLIASIFDTVVLSSTSSASIRTKVYRYSYPICASQVFALWCMWEVGKGMQRWRGRIKDEVYLIGERLHNFGERKPPEGSKSVIRTHG